MSSTASQPTKTGLKNFNVASSVESTSSPYQLYYIRFYPPTKNSRSPLSYALGYRRRWGSGPIDASTTIYIGVRELLYGSIGIGHGSLLDGLRCLRMRKWLGGFGLWEAEGSLMSMKSLMENINSMFWRIDDGQYYYQSISKDWTF